MPTCFLIYRVDDTPPEVPTEEEPIGIVFSEEKAIRVGDMRTDEDQYKGYKHKYRYREIEIIED